MSELNEKLYWLDRNTEGLKEAGYLLTEEQLLNETDFTADDIELLDKGEEVTGDYWGNDTYNVHRLYTEEEVKDALEWQGISLWDTDACVEMDEDYPEYVDEKYRIPVCCYELTGYTCDYLPQSYDNNPTFEKYKELLKPERLAIPYTVDDKIAAEISGLVHLGKITYDAYCETIAYYKGNAMETRPFSVTLNYQIEELVFKQPDIKANIYNELSTNVDFYLARMGLHPQHTTAEIDELPEDIQKLVFEFAKNLGPAEIFTRYSGDMSVEQDMTYSTFSDNINLKFETEIDIGTFVKVAVKTLDHKLIEPKYRDDELEEDNELEENMDK